MSLERAQDFVKELIATDRYYDVEHGSAQTIKGLTKIPLISKYTMSSGLDYRLLSQVQDQVVIKESGVVSEIEVYNQSKYPVLIPSGSLLMSRKQGKQDRTIVTNLMIGPGEELKIPVACVEQGRWRPRTFDEMKDTGVYKIRSHEDSDFGFKYLSSPTIESRVGSGISDRMYSAKMSGRDLSSLSRSLFVADQGAVWNQVQQELVEADAKNPTSALTEIHKKDKEEKLKFDIYDGEIGNVFIGMNKVLGMELYEKPDIWQNIAEDTIRRYKLGITGSKKLKKETLDDFFKGLKKSDAIATKSIGMGYDVRLVKGEVEGSCLVYKDGALHLAVVPKYENTGESVVLRYPRRTIRIPEENRMPRNPIPRFPGTCTGFPVYDPDHVHDILEDIRDTRNILDDVFPRKPRKLPRRPEDVKIGTFRVQQERPRRDNIRFRSTV